MHSLWPIAVIFQQGLTIHDPSWAETQFWLKKKDGKTWFPFVWKSVSRENMPPPPYEIFEIETISYLGVKIYPHIPLTS